MAEETTAVPTVDGSMQQQQQQQHHYQQQYQPNFPPPTLPPIADPADPAMDQQQQQQYRQSGSHLSCVSDKVDARAEALKEKEALEDRLERSVSGLSGRLQPSEGPIVPYDPQCGCIAPIPPYSTTPK